MSEETISRAGAASPTPEPRLHLIRRRSRDLIKRHPHTRLAWVVALASVFVAALVCTVLLEQVILAQSAFKLARIREQTTAAEARNQELLLEMTKLQSPERIEKYARAELGMVDPTSVDYVVADVGRLDRRVAVLRPSSGLPAAAGGSAAAVEGP